MSKHISISPQEGADRLAIRELVEAYAHCADRRDAQGQMSLFTTDTHFVVYMSAKIRRPHRNSTRVRSWLPSLQTLTSMTRPRTSSGRAQSSR
jgi:hypothetical protein